jgi:hypothetical protein
MSTTINLIDNKSTNTETKLEHIEMADNIRTQLALFEIRDYMKSILLFYTFNRITIAS